MSATALLPVFDPTSKFPSHNIVSFDLQRRDTEGGIGTEEEYCIRIFPLPPDADSKKMHHAGILETHLPNTKMSGGDPKPEGRTVYIKWAYDTKGIDKLSREANMYTTHLRHLQGTVIPKFYGFFTARDVNPTVACLVLEHIPDRGFKKGRNEYCRLFMLAICKIHQAGIMHNALWIDSDRHVLSCENGPRIIDFKLAKTHSCLGAYPVSYGYYGHTFAATANGQYCKELMDAEFRRGYQSDSDAKADKIAAVQERNKQRSFLLD